MAAARTGTTATTSAATETEFSSAAQRERRQRILDATLALASRGGYEAVQMRAVADRAGVALGTLYRYFPSKIHLLVSGLAREFERNQEKLDRIAIPGGTPYERMLFVLGRITRAMQREPMLTEAMTRAFMFADPSAAASATACWVWLTVKSTAQRASSLGRPSGRSATTRLRSSASVPARSAQSRIDACKARCSAEIAIGTAPPGRPCPSARDIHRSRAAPLSFTGPATTSGSRRHAIVLVAPRHQN